MLIVSAYVGTGEQLIQDLGRPHSMNTIIASLWSRLGLLIRIHKETNVDIFEIACVLWLVRRCL